MRDETSQKSQLGFSSAGMDASEVKEIKENEMRKLIVMFVES